MPKYLTLQEILEKYEMTILDNRLNTSLKNESIFKEGLYGFKNQLIIVKALGYFWDGRMYNDIALSVSSSFCDRKVFTLCQKKILTRYNKLKYKANPIDIDKSYIIV
jgi:hypothetical protein